jgi:plasmid stabilization system protein ParE
MSHILLSDLAVDQLKNMSPQIGQQMLEAMERLRTFPRSAPPLHQDGYELYRQLIVRRFRAVYRYFEQEDEVRIYCILPVRRRLPSSDFLTHQIF